jgi:hypothetical protein
LVVLWSVAISIPLYLIVHDVMVLDHGKMFGVAYWGRDFVILWTGGQLIAQGAIDTIYNVTAFQAKIAELFGHLDPMGYPYPPVTFPIAWSFGLLPYWLAQPCWILATGSLFLYESRRWWNERMGPRWLAVITPAALMNIWAGHYGFLHGALFLLGWNRLERNPRLAGVFFGCMLVKPHLAILVPIALLLRRQWVAIAAAGATVVALISLSSLLYGWSAWTDYVVRMTGPQVGLISAQKGFFTYMSTSTTTAVLRMAGDHHVAVAAQLLVSTAALATLVAAALRKTDLRDLALLTATLTFLVLPYGFNYDLTVVMIGAWTIVTRSDLPIGWRLMAAAGFLAPGIGMMFASLAIPATPAMLAMLACAQFRTLGREPRPLAITPSDATAAHA